MPVPAANAGTYVIAGITVLRSLEFLRRFQKTLRASRGPSTGDTLKDFNIQTSPAPSEVLHYRTLVICNVSFAELFADAQTNSNRFEATGRPPILFKQMSTRRQKQQFFVSTGLHSPAKDPHETFIIDRSVEHAIFWFFLGLHLGPRFRSGALFETNVDQFSRQP